MGTGNSTSLKSVDLTWLPTTRPSIPRSSRVRRVLTIDGGGMRGLIPLTILKKLEEETGKKVYELFDVIAGTSVGAIIAAASGLLRLSMEEIEKIFLELGKQIFGQGRLKSVSEFMCSWGWYSSERMAEFFKMLLVHRGLAPDILMNDPAFQDGPRVLFVTTPKQIVPWVSYLIRNYPTSGSYHQPSFNNIRVIYGLMGSACAPIFFPTLKGESSEIPLMDGGLTANNPTKIALSEVKSVFKVNPADLELVFSLGTGQEPVVMSPRGLITLVTEDWVKKATDSQQTHQEMKNDLSRRVYFRANPQISAGLQLDAIHPQTVQYLQFQADGWLTHNPEILSKVKSILSRPTGGGLSPGRSSRGTSLSPSNRSKESLSPGGSRSPRSRASSTSPSRSRRSSTSSSGHRQILTSPNASPTPPASPRSSPRASRSERREKSDRSSCCLSHCSSRCSSPSSRTPVAQQITVPTTQHITITPPPSPSLSSSHHIISLPTSLQFRPDDSLITDAIGLGWNACRLKMLTRVHTTLLKLGWFKQTTHPLFRLHLSASNTIEQILLSHHYQQGSGLNNAVLLGRAGFFYSMAQSFKHKKKSFNAFMGLSATMFNSMNHSELEFEQFKKSKPNDISTLLQFWEKSLKNH